MPDTPTPAVSHRPATGLLLAITPVTVAATASLAAIVLVSFRLPLFPAEMLAAAIVAVVAGLLATLPLTLAARSGRTDRLPMAALQAIALRPLLMILGLALTLGPGWGLTRIAVILWLLGFYFPLLAAETAVTTRVLRSGRGP